MIATRTGARAAPSAAGSCAASWAPVPAGQDSMVESWIAGSGEPIRVDWRVRETPAGKRIVDVVIAGVSMLVTQRSEFAAVNVVNGESIQFTYDFTVTAGG